MANSDPGVLEVLRGGDGKAVPYHVFTGSELGDSICLLCEQLRDDHEAVRVPIPTPFVFSLHTDDIDLDIRVIDPDMGKAVILRVLPEALKRAPKAALVTVGAMIQAELAGR